jgi:hypothetical protein
VYTNTTISFHPDELSTVQVVPTATQVETYRTSLSTGTGSTTITSTYTYYATTTPAALNYEVLGQNCSTVSGYTYVAGNPTAVEGVNSKLIALRWLISDTDRAMHRPGSVSSDHCRANTPEEFATIMGVVFTQPDWRVRFL